MFLLPTPADSAGREIRKSSSWGQQSKQIYPVLRPQVCTDPTHSPTQLAWPYLSHGAFKWQPPHNTHIIPPKRHNQLYQLEPSSCELQSELRIVGPPCGWTCWALYRGLHHGLYYSPYIKRPHSWTLKVSSRRTVRDFANLENHTPINSMSWLVGMCRAVPLHSIRTL